MRNIHAIRCSSYFSSRILLSYYKSFPRFSYTCQRNIFFQNILLLHHMHILLIPRLIFSILLCFSAPRKWIQ